MKFAIVTLALFFLLAGRVAATESPEDGWRDLVRPVADLWSSHLGYNVRSAQDAAVPDEVDFNQVSKRGPDGGGECSNTTEVVCEGHGDCMNGTCVCYDGWAGLYCHHERKEKLTAFLLEFFIGAITGAGSFYLGYIGQGVGKLVLYWGGCLLLCIGNPIAATMCKDVARVLGLVVINLLATAMIAGVGIWCFVDWILILCDSLDDYDGYYLNGF